MNNTNILTGKARTNHELTVMALVGLLYVLACLLKAWLIPLTHDEAVTVINGVLQGFKPLIRFTFVDANNHILNTWLATFTTRIFGNSELAIRLPNLMACLLYVGCAGWISRRFNASWQGLVILLMGLPVAEYFSMARGYGLANALVLLAVVWLVKGTDSQAIDYWLYAPLAALLAAAANYSYLVVYINILMICAASIIRSARPFRQIAAGLNGAAYAALVVHVCLGIYLLYPLQKLMQAKSFYIGGRTGFFQDTVLSILHDMFGKIAIEPYPFWTVGILMAILACGLVSAIRGLGKQGSTAALLAGLVLLCAATTLVLHHVLDVNYPTGRAALYYYVLFAVMVVSAESLKPARTPIALILLAVFLIRYDFTNAGFDSDTKKAVTAMALDARQRNQTIRLAVDWIHEPAIRYYQGRIEAPYEFAVDRTGYPNNRDYYNENRRWYDPLQIRILRTNYNYAYVTQSNLVKLTRAYRVTILQEYPRSGNTLCYLE